uniref:Uncharacterized protein n=1 Tax=Anguilla anguilla TaxID=7936 RepID=A0A0E9P8C3_ANGAN
MYDFSMNSETRVHWRLQRHGFRTEIWTLKWPLTGLVRLCASTEMPV